MINNKTINIINGDSAAGSFKFAFHTKRDEIVVFRDVLSCGPLQKFSNFENWQLLRESFWRDTDSNNYEYIQSFKGLPRDFYNNFVTLKSVSECKLWIGTGLSDQLLLAFIIHLFDNFNFDFNKLLIIQFEKIKSTNGNCYPVQGLGLLHPNQIKDHPISFNINTKQIKYAKLAWEAFTDSSPKQYIRFMKDSDEIMPLLKNAMSYVHYRYPKSTNGLSSWDDSLLKNTVVHGPKASKVIGYTMADGMDGLDYVGDTYLYGRLKNLASPKLNNPLLKISPQDSSMQKTVVHITDFGKRVLENKVNVIQENGINDWVGGVNLNSSSNCIWVRECTKLFQLETMYV